MSVIQESGPASQVLEAAIAQREAGDAAFDVGVFLSEVDAGLDGDALAAIEESDERDYKDYVLRAQRVGLINAERAAELSAMPPQQRNPIVSRLMRDLLIEERNVEILLDAMEQGLVSEESFRRVMMAGIDRRTEACNRLHTALRKLKGDDLTESQRTSAAIGAGVRNRVAEGTHPLALTTRIGGIEFNAGVAF